MRNCFFLTSNGNILVTGSKNFFMTPKSEFVRFAGESEVSFLKQKCPRILPQKGQEISLPKENPLWKYLWCSQEEDYSGEYNKFTKNFFFVRKRNSKIEFLTLTKVVVDSGYPQDSFGQYQGSGTAEIKFIDVEFSKEDLEYFQKNNIQRPDTFRVWSMGNKISHGDTYSVEKYGYLCSMQDVVFGRNGEIDSNGTGFFPGLSLKTMNSRVRYLNFITDSNLTLDDVKNFEFKTYTRRDLINLKKSR